MSTWRGRGWEEKAQQIAIHVLDVVGSEFSASNYLKHFSARNLACALINQVANGPSIACVMFERWGGYFVVQASKVLGRVEF